MQRHDHSPGTGLDEADRKRLAAALAGAREARVYRRLEALLLVAEGHSMAEAARRCRVDRSSGLCRKHFVAEFQLLGWRSQWRRNRCSRAGILSDRDPALHSVV